jgi:hypothetical protein
MTMSPPFETGVPSQAVEQTVKAIGGLLESAAAAGERVDRIFRDWVELLGPMVAELRVQPVADLRFRSDQKTSQAFAERLTAACLPQADPKRYRAYQDHFRQMTIRLLSDSWWLGPADILGRLYQQYGVPNSYLGQHFTPWTLAAGLVRLNLTDGVDQVRERLRTAYGRAAHEGQEAFWQAWEADFNADLDQFVEDDRWGRELAKYVLGWIWPYLAAPYRVLDPATGSGVLILAAAMMVPPWMLRVGLVQFYAVEIDPFVAQLARVNATIYGIPLQLVT